MYSNKAIAKAKKIATLEISILIESLLREHAERALKNQGFSNNKIKELSCELSFNNILNLILPLSLTKTQRNKLKESISQIDALRRIRNDVMHGNIQENDIDELLVAKGIEGALKLVKFLISQ